MLGRALFAVVRTVVVAFCRLYFRVTVEGREHLPATGPYVIAPVHRSNVDTFVQGALTRRRLRFMAKDSIFKIGPLARLFRLMGSFPVRRGSADREALRNCIEVLAEGEPLIIFPEGTRQSGPVVQPLFDGAAYVAVKAGVPIVPVGIGGSERAMPKGSKLVRPVKIHVVVGEPIRPPAVAAGERAPRRVVHELTEQLQVRLQALFDEAQAKVGLRG